MGSKTKALRADGILPLHVYGLSDKSLSLQAPTKEVVNVIRAAGRTRLVSVKVKGADKPETCLVRGIDVHPVSGNVLHVDFLRVGDAEIMLDVPIELVNVASAPVARRMAVSITQVLAKVRVKATPDKIPQSLKANCLKLAKVTDTITNGELEIPDGVQLISDPDVRIVSVQLTRAARAAQ